MLKYEQGATLGGNPEAMRMMSKYAATVFG